MINSKAFKNAIALIHLCLYHWLWQQRYKGCLDNFGILNQAWRADMALIYLPSKSLTLK